MERIIGEEIKAKREEMGITRKKMAEDIGISWYHLRNVEQGHTKCGLRTLGKMLKYLNLPMFVKKHLNYYLN